MMMDRIRVLDDLIAKKNDTGTGKLSGAEIKKRKREFVKLLNLNDPNSMSKEEIHNIADKWTAICDTDGDGLISIDEFTSFFNAMDGIFMSEEEI